MSIIIPENGCIDAFAIIVDINGFTSMVAKDDSAMTAQFVRDVLAGTVDAIENEGGEIISYMGDAVLGVLPTAKSVVHSCISIAKDLDRQCEYICNDNAMWPFALGGPSLKIAVEYGGLNISSITSRFLGTQCLFIGNAINYASRISSAGNGNRCLIGPVAAKKISLEGYELTGPYLVKGKAQENPYTYYHFDLGEIWIEGERKKGRDTYWG